MFVSTRELVRQARLLLKEQRKLRPGPAAKSAIEELFQAAIYVEQYVKDLEGVDYRTALASYIKEVIDINGKPQEVCQGYGLAWRALDVTHRTLTRDDSAALLLWTVAGRVIDSLSEMDASQLHFETIEIYIDCFVNIQPFDLVNKVGGAISHTVVADNNTRERMLFPYRPSDEKKIIRTNLSILGQLISNFDCWLNEDFRF